MLWILGCGGQFFLASASTVCKLASWLVIFAYVLAGNCFGSANSPFCHFVLYFLQRICLKTWGITLWFSSYLPTNFAVNYATPSYCSKLTTVKEHVANKIWKQTRHICRTKDLCGVFVGDCCQSCKHAVQCQKVEPDAVVQ